MRKYRYLLAAFYDRGNHHNYRQYEKKDRVKVYSVADLWSVLRDADDFASLLTSGGKVIEDISFYDFHEDPDAYLERFEKFFEEAEKVPAG